MSKQERIDWQQPATERYGTMYGILTFDLNFITVFAHVSLLQTNSILS
jgi:hypothetical protein